MKFGAPAILAVIEPILYGTRARPRWIAFLALATVLLLWQALQIRSDAGFDKFVPLDHPYMQVLQQYRHEFGGANALLVALAREDREIYDADFLATLKAATDEVFFTPGIDRARVSSLFTPDVRFYEVVEGGFGGGANVVPAEYRPTPEMFELVRRNVARAGIVGRYVSKDQRGAMIFSEVLEVDPGSGRRLDYRTVAEHLEQQVRLRFTHPLQYEWRLKRDLPPFEKGEVIAERFSAPDWTFGWRRFEAAKEIDGQLQRVSYRADDVEVTERPNPQYLPGLKVHIIGFAKMVGEVAGATTKVVGFFVLTVVAAMLALWWYLGSLRLALLPLACSLVAVIWEFGLLRLFGFGLDPFAILVPFLVLAVSTSHGVQYVNIWADEIMMGRNGFDASLETFRRLAIPGTIALLTNVAGFLTIYLVPIGIVREMSINACLGMFAVIVTNKVMMPVWLSYLGLRDVERFRARREIRREAGDRVWALLAKVTDRRIAAGLIACSLAVLALSWWKQGDRIIGDAQAGVPELRPESVYNRDTYAIVDNFSIGVDLIKIIAETDANSCIHHSVQEQIDRLAWHLQNTPGVSSVAAMPQIVRQAYAAFSDSFIKFQVLPRNENVLVLLNTKITTTTGLLNWDCSAMPVLAFTADHKANTIAGIIDTVARYNGENRAMFFAAHPEVDGAYCDAKTAARRAIGREEEALRRYGELRKAAGVSDHALVDDADYLAREVAVKEARAAYAAMGKACPVHFAPAAGNVGVMAATNEVVEDKELATVLAVYVVIVIFLALAYRSWAGVLAICIPLFMVSIFANALMAVFGIGMKVATLPVVALAVGIGVDYGIYFYDVIQHEVRANARSLHDAYFEALRQTGKAVIFTGVCLAGGVATWWWSDLQFQRDMGVLLTFMFTANMLGAVLLCPAYCRYLMKLPRG